MPLPAGVFRLCLEQPSEDPVAVMQHTDFPLIEGSGVGVLRERLVAQSIAGAESCKPSVFISSVRLNTCRSPLGPEY